MSVVGRCDIPFPFHLCVNVVLREPKILSLEKGKIKYFNLVEHVMGEEKYECVILKIVINVSSNGSSNVNWVCFRGSILGSLYLYLWYSQTISVSKMGGSMLSINGALWWN